MIKLKIDGYCVDEVFIKETAIEFGYDNIPGFYYDAWPPQICPNPTEYRMMFCFTEEIGSKILRMYINTKGHHFNKLSIFNNDNDEYKMFTYEYVIIRKYDYQMSDNNIYYRIFFAALKLDSFDISKKEYLELAKNGVHV